MPMFGVMRETFEEEVLSMRVEVVFFSVARTMPLVAFTVGEGQLLRFLCMQKDV